MGLFKRTFGPSRPPARPYVDEGLAFTKKLVVLFGLTDWDSGTLTPLFTKSEAEAIDQGLESFQRIANQSAPDGQQMIFHPDIVDPLQRTLGAEALHDLAGRFWEYTDDCPVDWKARVSTYLKAWAMHLDPDVLLDLSRLLALAGYKSEAKQSAAIVVAWFPNYAPRFFGGTAAPHIVSGITSRAREIMQDIS